MLSIFVIALVTFTTVNCSGDIGYNAGVAAYSGERGGYGGLSAYQATYLGECDQDGWYYYDEASYKVCTNGIAWRQPCPLGTKNSHFVYYGHSGYGGMATFCNVNLVARGHLAHAAVNKVHDYRDGMAGGVGYTGYTGVHGAATHHEYGNYQVGSYAGHGLGGYAGGGHKGGGYGGAMDGGYGRGGHEGGIYGGYTEVGQDAHGVHGYEVDGYRRGGYGPGISGGHGVGANRVGNYVGYGGGHRGDGYLLPH